MAIAPAKDDVPYTFFADLGTNSVSNLDQIHWVHGSLENRCRSCHEVDGKARPESTAYQACATCHGGAQAFTAH